MHELKNENLRNLQNKINNFCFTQLLESSWKYVQIKPEKHEQIVS